MIVKNFNNFVNFPTTSVEIAVLRYYNQNVLEKSMQQRRDEKWYLTR